MQGVPSPTKDVLTGQSSPTLPDSSAVTSDGPSANERDANGEPSPPAQRPTITVFTNLETLDFAIREPSAAAEPGPEYKEITVTVSGPNGYTSSSIHSIEGGKEATFSVVQEDGTPLPDGLYKYEAYARTELVSGAVADDAENRATDESGRKANDRVIQELSKRPSQQVLSGTFTALDGQIVQPDEERPQRPE